MLTIRTKKKKNLSNNTAKIERKKKTSVRISFVNDNRYNTRQQYVRIINRRRRRKDFKEYTKHAKIDFFNKKVSLMLVKNFHCY
jgi:hypothetical protein